MITIRDIIRNFICTCCLTLMLFSCSTVPILKVTYRLPSESANLINKKVYLRIEDNRPGKDMIGEGAGSDFEHFTGLFILYLAEGEGEKTKLGAYDLKSMFYEAFKKRLTQSGIEVVQPDRADQTGLVIKLNKFVLDLVGRKWVFDVAYEAVLMKQGQVLFSQTLQGEAERLKIFGLDQADAVISELITDVVNRPDLVEIFQKLNQQAG